MRDDESLSAYLTKLFDLINQMRSYGEDLARVRIVQKLLISLPLAYDSICYVIEHSKDLDEIKIQEVVASFKSFELRLDRHSGDKTEKAFASLVCIPNQKNTVAVKVVLRIKRIRRQKAKSGIINQLMEPKIPANIMANEILVSVGLRENQNVTTVTNLVILQKIAIARNQHNNSTMLLRPNPQQLNYATHIAKDCYSNKGSASVKGCDDVWYLDSGCSNHMTGREDVLVDVDRNITAKVAMGT
ncbi:hypothetical protein L3X38_028016 [Prunus dulcis]|uniref:Retrovirus-related Pol polyprotein from transposon TNT 1-94-like beta-barrel domain-containing protein n=1 Tax=Prunus dulcis TaxID=3755 RepID=A0AAD4VP34_PRUDU|nr:hypothetical protein L3X38_028016 [Prunus dulcis]